MLSDRGASVQQRAGSAQAARPGSAQAPAVAKNGPQPLGESLERPGEGAKDAAEALVDEPGPYGDLEGPYGISQPAGGFDEALEGDSHHVHSPLGSEGSGAEEDDGDAALREFVFHELRHDQGDEPSVRPSPPSPRSGARRSLDTGGSPKASQLNASLDSLPGAVALSAVGPGASPVAGAVCAVAETGPAGGSAGAGMRASGSGLPPRPPPSPPILSSLPPPSLSPGPPPPSPPSGQAAPRPASSAFATATAQQAGVEALAASACGHEHEHGHAHGHGHTHGHGRQLNVCKSGRCTMSPVVRLLYGVSQHRRLHALALLVALHGASRARGC